MYAALWASHALPFSYDDRRLYSEAPLQKYGAEL
jgi:hypothetical protein